MLMDDFKLKVYIVNILFSLFAPPPPSFIDI